ncbi:MAG: choice-of-anchor L domain-containing protein [Flavobacteriales bacterium]
MALSPASMPIRGLLFSLLTVVATVGRGQLVVDASFTPEQLVQNVLLGGGVSISNITFNGVPLAPVSEQIGSFTAPAGSNLGLLAGLIMSTGQVQSDPDNFEFGANGDVTDFASSTLAGASDPDLEDLSGQAINDAAILEFDFVPTGDSLKFRYVFGSEEYPSFTCSDYNDAFGFFLSGPGIAGPFSNGAINIALVPGTNIPVSINTLNSGESSGGDETDCEAADPNWQSNSVYFVDNAAQSGTIVTYDGFTTVLTAFALVQCGESYHIKLAIGDGFDQSYDSGVFLEAGSFTSTGQVIPTLTPGPGIVGNTINEGCAPVELTFVRQGDVTLAESVQMVIGGTATPDVDYSPALPTQLDFAAEDSTVTFILDVPLDADGPEELVITITQLVACANTNVETEFVFGITSPEPLNAEGSDVDALCGDVNVLAPIITGGVGEYQFLWSTGETTPSIVVSPEVTTAYDFTVTDGCSVEPFYGTLIVSLPVYEPLQIEVSPATLVPCLETEQIGVISTTGGNGSYTYAWTALDAVAGVTPTITVPSPTTPLWYQVVVTEGCGDSVVDSVLVSMAPLDPIVITTTGDVTVQCPGDTVLVAIASITGGNGVYTYQWTDQLGNTVGSDDRIEVGVPTDMLYTIEAADQCGTEGAAQVWTRLPIYDPFQVSVTPDQLICLGDSAVLEVTVAGGSGQFFINWVEQESTDPVMVVQPEEETTYMVSVTDQCGEELFKDVTVAVEDVYLLITTENLGQDDWHLRAATLPQALTHVWDMGDGSRYREEHVYHSYVDLEEHWVNLRVTTPNGCTATDSVLLKPPAHVYFPNAFSPDGDGNNDAFGPVGHDIDEFEMTVFDRWGAEVFTTTSMDDLWTGTVNGGTMATTGVYVYKYRVAGLYMPSTEGIGHVTLLKGTQD